MALPDSLAGRMLIAMPGIGDPRFERAVILVCAHNDDHAMGLTVNRPVDGLTLPNLLSRLGVESTISLPDDLVLFGGPVERERGFVLHTADYVTPQSTIVITETIGMSGSVGPRIDMERFQLVEGDRILVCTNGITDMLDESVIASVLEWGASPDDQSRRLVDLAMEAGGDDDATALVADFKISS